LDSIPDSGYNNLNGSIEQEEEKLDFLIDKDIDEKKHDFGSLKSLNPSARKSQPNKRKMEYETEEKKLSGSIQNSIIP
jgi:hypothetical protein